MEITEEESRRMPEILEGTTDPRRQWGQLLHNLLDVLVIGQVTILA